MASSLHLSRLRKWLLASPPLQWTISHLRELLIAALKQGPIPQHVAFVMDGNRRFARSHRIERVEGHNLGFEALARVFSFSFSLSPLPFILGFFFFLFSFCLYGHLFLTDVYLPMSFLDIGGLLSSWCQSCHDIRFQYREFQTLKVRGGCLDGYG